MINDGSEEEELERRSGVVCVLVRTKKKQRKASTLLEEWAERSLVTIFKADQFGDKDKEFGDSLASQLQSNHKLSDAQWPWAIKLAQRYQQYVAPPVDPRQQDLFGDKPK